jgi:hypothetical protein
VKQVLSQRGLHVGKTRITKSLKRVTQARPFENTNGTLPEAENDQFSVGTDEVYQ